MVKAYSLGLDMEMMLTKTNGKQVLGAYDKTHKRIYLFDGCDLDSMRQTLLHEIGHAVHSYCVDSKAILKTAKKAGWQLKEFRSTFLADNTMYPIVLQARDADSKAWEDALQIFSERELKNKRTADGRYVLEAPAKYLNRLEYQNPLETFACMYEQQYR
ncbi:MAG: hypothetical protein WC838_03300, partial [Candidatus Margulisiibacteriota bacterium]|jgi:hypothetical protein